MNTSRNRLITLVATAFAGTAALYPDQPQGDSADQPGRAVSGQQGEGAADVQAVARQVIEALDYDAELSFHEAEQLLRLCDAPLSTKLETIRLGLADEESAERVGNNAAFLVKATAGLDPSGALSAAIMETCLRPVFQRPDSSDESIWTASQILQQLPMKDAKTVANMVFERILIEKDPYALELLFEVLVPLVSELESDDAKRMAQAALRRITTAEEGEIWDGGYVLIALSTRLPASEVRLLVDSIQERMNTERDRGSRYYLGSLSLALAPRLDREEALALSGSLLKRDPNLFETFGPEALNKLLPELERDTIRIAAGNLVERMTIERDPHQLQRLADTLKPLTSEFSPPENRALLTPLVAQTRIGEDTERRCMLAGSLGPIAADLERKELRAITAWLVELLKTRQDENLFLFEDAVDALVSLAGAIAPVDARAVAATVADLQSNPNRTGKFYIQLNRVLAALVQHLEPSDARRLAADLTKVVKAGDASVGKQLDSLGCLAPMLESRDVRPAAVILVNALLAVAGGEENMQESRMRYLRMTLKPIAARLSAEDARPLVAELSARMKSERDGAVRAELGRAVGVMAGALEGSDLNAAISALIDRIKVEQIEHSLERLTKALRFLAPVTDPDQARSTAAALVERMEDERDGKELAHLGRALAPLARKLGNAHSKPAVQILVEAVKNERDGVALGELAKCIGAFFPQLSKDERRQVAELITARIPQAWFADMAEYSWAEISWSDGGEVRSLEEAVRVLEAASIPSLVDTLRAPLITQDYLIEAILQALEKKIGQPFDRVGAFVKWAASDPDAAALGIDLEGPGPRPVSEEHPRTALPALEGIEIKPLGSLEVEGASWKLCVKEERVYLPSGIAGLHIVDLADPGLPRLLGSAPVGPYAIACGVAGDYAFVATGPAGWPESHVRVADISDASAPRQVGNIDLTDYPADVAVQGNTVFVADRTKGLRVLDGSKPKSPREVGSLEFPSVIVGVAVAGDLAVLADQEVGLRVVDISTPEKPMELSILKTEGPGLDVCVHDETAYLATGDKGLVVIDISDPRAPRQMAVIPTEIALSVSVHKTLAAVGAGPKGITIIDLSDPAAPTARDLEMSALGIGVFLRDHHLYVTDVKPGGAPYGRDDRTILRVYRMDGEDGEPQSKRD